MFGEHLLAPRAAAAAAATAAGSSSSTASPSTSGSGLRVKVLSLKSGVIRRIQMSPKDTFSVIYALMASAEGVGPEDVKLTLRDTATVVKPGDTYGDHGLTICDIVECVVIGKVCFNIVIWPFKNDFIDC